MQERSGRGQDSHETNIPGEIEIPVSVKHTSVNQPQLEHPEIQERVRESLLADRFQGLVEGLREGTKSAYVSVKKPGTLRIIVFSTAAVAAAAAAGVELGAYHGRHVKEVFGFLRKDLPKGRKRS